MVIESESKILLGKIWIYAKKERVLGEEKGNTNLRGRENVEMYHKM